MFCNHSYFIQYIIKNNNYFLKTYDFNLSIDAKCENNMDNIKFSS